MEKHFLPYQLECILYQQPRVVSLVSTPQCLTGPHRSRPHSQAHSLHRILPPLPGPVLSRQRAPPRQTGRHPSPVSLQVYQASPRLPIEHPIITAIRASKLLALVSAIRRAIFAAVVRAKLWALFSAVWRPIDSALVSTIRPAEFISIIDAIQYSIFITIFNSFVHTIFPA